MYGSASVRAEAPIPLQSYNDIDLTIRICEYKKFFITLYYQKM